MSDVITTITVKVKQDNHQYHRVVANGRTLVTVREDENPVVAIKRLLEALSNDRDSTVRFEKE